MSITNYKHTCAERFMRYVQIDTEADPNSDTQPSSMKQKDLLSLLAQELRDMGIEDAEMDEHGYVYATIPSNIEEEVPVICFCSHADTAPDVTGANVQPVLHKNYDGQPISYKDDSNLFLTTEDHPYLLERIGDDIITASGKTLLGADDKAGVAIIMDLANYLVTHPEIKHGKIRILFTPDEEIGRGVNKVDMQRLGADYGYTLDGGPRGVLEGESFSADSATL
ncbi:MAG: tripeptide aminopeptidase PepT, partial [Bacteroidia bacterium]|nr:tripeptide aminopeptidase PepT [Bacteroidia bacterium]